eukprot:12853341-Alexandrium_andersonii.AAC.1
MIHAAPSSPYPQQSSLDGGCPAAHPAAQPPRPGMEPPPVDSAKWGDTAAEYWESIRELR